MGDNLISQALCLGMELGTNMSGNIETSSKVPHLSPVKRHRRGIRRKTVEAAYV